MGNFTVGSHQNNNSNGNIQVHTTLYMYIMHWVIDTCTCNLMIEWRTSSLMLGSALLCCSSNITTTVCSFCDAIYSGVWPSCENNNSNGNIQVHTTLYYMHWVIDTCTCNLIIQWLTTSLMLGSALCCSSNSTTPVCPLHDDIYSGVWPYCENNNGTIKYTQHTPSCMSTFVIFTVHVKHFIT